MVEMEKRLEKLSRYVEAERRKGFVASLPDKIKKEALYLVTIFGMKKIADPTTLTRVSLCSWRRIMHNVFLF